MNKNIFKNEILCKYNTQVERDFSSKEESNVIPHSKLYRINDKSKYKPNNRKAIILNTSKGRDSYKSQHLYEYRSSAEEGPTNYKLPSLASRFGAVQ